MRDPINPTTDTGDPGSSGRIPFSQQAWTLDTIKVHFDAMLAAQRQYFSDILSIQEQTNRDRFTNAEKAVGSALAASERQLTAMMSASKEAITKAETAADKRFDSLNELRAAMLDQQTKFAERSGTDLQFKALGERVTEVKDGIAARVDAMEKKQDAIANKILGVGMLIAFAVSVVAIFGGVFGGGG